MSRGVEETKRKRDDEKRRREDGGEVEKRLRKSRDVIHSRQPHGQPPPYTDTQRETRSGTRPATQSFGFQKKKKCQQMHDSTQIHIPTAAAGCCPMAGAGPDVTMASGMKNLSLAVFVGL